MSNIASGTTSTNSLVYTGDVTGNLVLQTNGTTTALTLTTTQNALFANAVSATGNVSGNYILGNGALLTGVTTSSNSIFNGTSNVTVTSSGGNVSIGVGGTANVAVFSTTGMSATGNVTGNYIIGNGSQLTGIASTVTITQTTLAANLTIANGQNGLSVGPITYANNVQVTLSPGQRWIIL